MYINTVSMPLVTSTEPQKKWLCQQEIKPESLQQPGKLEAGKQGKPGKLVNKGWQDLRKVWGNRALGTGLYSPGVWEKAGVCTHGWDPLLLQNSLVEHHSIQGCCTKIKQLLFIWAQNKMRQQDSHPVSVCSPLYKRNRRGTFPWSDNLALVLC